MISFTISKNWNEIKESCDNKDISHFILIDLNNYSHNLKYIKNYGYYLDDNWESHNFNDYNLQQSLNQYFKGFLKCINNE